LALVHFLRVKTDEVLTSPEHVRGFGRFLPLLIVLAAVVGVWALGLNRYLSFSSIAENRELLRSFVAANVPLSLAAYGLVYFLATVVLLPGAALLTILGGFLFGWQIAAALTIVAATLGATLIFLVARSSIGDVFVRRAGQRVNKLACGFAANAFSYLLFLRLVPLFPFCVVNIAPALFNVGTRAFFFATLIGIAPATIAYSVLGAGLDSIIESELKDHNRCLALGGQHCALNLDPAELFTAPMIAAFLLLGMIALLPPLLKHFRSGALKRVEPR
jgi:uncharacterized membrane protein YdjX (TVP38/TMEM64 family)